MEEKNLSKYRNILGINHIGITVPNIDQATSFFKAAFGAKIAYDGLSYEDKPRAGEIAECQLGLSKNTQIIKQRMLVIGKEGPNLELFEMDASVQKSPVSLQDIGISHISLFVSDIDNALSSAVKAGASPLSEIHGNSRYEDTIGSSSVYVKAPWGTLIELQAIPNGYYYPEYSESKVWIPKN